MKNQQHMKKEHILSVRHIMPSLSSEPFKIPRREVGWYPHFIGYKMKLRKTLSSQDKTPSNEWPIFTWLRTFWLSSNTLPFPFVLGLQALGRVTQGWFMLLFHFHLSQSLSQIPLTHSKISNICFSLFLSLVLFKPQSSMVSFAWALDSGIQLTINEFQSLDD